MANASFYTFAKRKNSTLQPTGTPSAIDIQLKSGTSLISPTFLLSYSGRPTFNYVIYEGRNYFINDITSVRNDLWEISCTEDFLGTWKTDIGGTTALILYASGGRTDIIDTRIEVDSSVSTNTSEAAVNGFTINQIAAGAVILSVTGIGSFGNYMLQSYSDMYHMIENVGAFWATLGISSVEDALQQFFYGGNVADCVKGAIALPFALSYSDYSANLGPQEQLYLGSYPCTNGVNPIFVHKVNNPVYKATTTISIPWQVSDWRRHSPYTTLQLYLPLIGTMNLNSDELVGFSSLDITYSLNIASGDLAVEVSTDSPIKIIATASNNVAMSLPFGSANISPTKVMASGMTAIAGIAAGIATGVAGKGAAAALGAAGSGMALGASQLLGAGQQSGGGGLSGGASQGLFKNIKLVAVTRHLTDSQANLDSVIGKPVMKKATIGSYSGYVQTDGMEVSGNMLDQEREAINNLCNGGIYYE
jgi:hypothetical protein